jgi:hypothetical protein
MLSSCKYIVSLIVLLLLTGSGSAAFAYDWVVTAKVTMVEPTYVPSYVDFMVDGSAGNCPAGSVLCWTIQGLMSRRRSPMPMRLFPH